MANVDLTAHRARELFDYNPETGHLTWRRKEYGADEPNSTIDLWPGKQAGCWTSAGYISIIVDGKPKQAHRIIWAHVHGAPPSNCIDHINGVRDDNRISNLRDVSRAMNSQNRRQAQGGRSLPLGVKASVGKGRTTYNATLTLGGFATPEEAHAVYLEMKRRHHAGCTI